MLADVSGNVQSGQFGQDVHLPSTTKIGIVQFIAQELLKWRDDSERPVVNAETQLTEHLCDYLTNAAQRSVTWDHIQFRTETSDETVGGRTIDMSAKPLGSAVIIADQRYTIYQALFPIECKRLPTPQGSGRDSQEYVVTANKTTGGIQRFKFGLHGASHNFAAMIAYVQQHDFSHWLTEINGWIQVLANQPNSEWTSSDLLQPHNNTSDAEVWTLESNHERVGVSSSIELRHLWINMQ
jgi:hypothetical protein